MTSGKDQTILLENSRSVAFRDLPPIPKGADDGNYGTILLMYQYVEPSWGKKEHKKALKKIIELGQKLNITGRGRVAPEGVNFTLSGMPKDVRAFCTALREWNPLFNETDFKLTDWLPKDKLFKSLSIRKTEELVAYGLAGDDKAPSLKKFAGTHLEADEYHKAMTDKDTVIVDVRNAYESAIGSFRPPEGGAELIDPKMRNSIEFPKWLNDPATQEKLNGKKVLMYCTGGIRCERATALLNQMSAVNPNLKPKRVYHMRGGIDRYVKTFPDGGFWKGKNYLFDRRMEQIPGTKNPTDVEEEVDSKCCLCRQKWASYRGKFKCSQSLCGVPVIVCPSCDDRALREPERLTCELCKEGYRVPEVEPDLVSLKRKAECLAEGLTGNDADAKTNSSPRKRKTEEVSEKGSRKCHPGRLFLSRLPLTVTKAKIEESLELVAKVKLVHWLTDRNSGAFYGSCLVQLETTENQAEVLKMAAEIGIKIDKKKVKVSPVWIREGDQWPPMDYVDRQYPPVGL
ncbi:hypothetical protein FisN_12Lh332 [Fistulifera solaris]|jgi:predicted sulfurtransferase|uniref:Rhodanese domain-containing protein n=1 Tax=Fistulifera solaris TaxID=1519565 RepID=A0A1Z5JMF4_FISSO|nr:hypothetical protein FisN_12Lh332 [Fistulifera solaris]|eukprot:GAX14968.1 hypothetical protein FisN_12Lh332 [Fistulifera solaris]